MKTAVFIKCRRLFFLSLFIWTESLTTSETWKWLADVFIEFLDPLDVVFIYVVGNWMSCYIWEVFYTIMSHLPPPPSLTLAYDTKIIIMMTMTRKFHSIDSWMAGHSPIKLLKMFWGEKGAVEVRKVSCCQQFRSFSPPFYL